jgi:hypothetical protein
MFLSILSFFKDHIDVRREGNLRFGSQKNPESWVAGEERRWLRMDSVADNGPIVSTVGTRGRVENIR